ncbi:MAG: poly(R)-hydroxyalkanoic acid synthase subunit PhaE [Steroidobacteraceae bacterium]
MSASGTDSTTAFSAWLEQQREFLQRLSREQDPARLRAELEKWWQRAGAQATPQAQDVAARLFELGHGYLQGLQQFAQTAGGAGSASGAPFDFGLDLLAAWRSARWGGDAAGFTTASALLAPWLEALAKMAPVGAARPYVNDARELAQLQAECLQLEEALTLLLQRVQNEALTQLQARVAERAQSGEPIQNFRQLYELWIECGERAYAVVAHGAEFIKLQTDFTNRAMRMRVIQRRLAERVARTLDLPTRTEVNALHLQVRDLKRRLNRESAAAQSAKTKTAKARPR